MSEKLAIEILKQATIETTTGACEKCPRKDKNKTCIGCLDEAKEQVLLEIERLNKKIEQYENPEDMALMFMWCDEKAKDEIKRLNNIINELEDSIDRFKVKI